MLPASAIVQCLLEAVVVPAASQLTSTFGQDFAKLPPDVKQITHEKYHRWRANPQSLNFEPKFKTLYVIEVTRKYHAVCNVVGPAYAANVVWLRILSYDEYRAYLSASRKG